MTQVHPTRSLPGTTSARADAQPHFVTRAIGSSSLRVFPLALSGNVFGWTADDAAATSILDTFAEGEGNFIDTADSYAAGRSELMIGRWMRERRNRDAMVVATKVGKSRENPGMHAEAIKRSVTASLSRLGTSHIDLLYLHIDDESVDFDETLLAVDELIGEGKVRYFGGSDHTGNRLIQARIACGQMGVAPMVAIQSHYNLLHRQEYETGLAHVAAIQGLGMMPRFALASGFLSGKYRQRADLASNPRGHDAAKYLRRKGFKVLNALDEIAEEHDTAVATIALAWLLNKPGVAAPVVSASRATQVPELLAAARVHLTRHQSAELDRASAY
ncbi:aldo/keto reductase [Salinibacterium sp. M195]|uniref:aldo/keto reductase n=1 Tax=Salinibacterium sp. M195 TaxID=2583374 RepID=UPI001C62A019|nr:aldo/keto reductase [Salinibacterium sp. M195]QYH36467.1 aldo/keto reductase [Salinibacterium sp. M195]